MSGQPTDLEESQSDGARAGAVWLWLAAFVGALALYVFTLAPGLVWQDGGEYQWTAARLTWPPAQGTVWSRPGEAVRVHPWFLVAARGLWWPRFWDYAYAANLCSAISMALAAANVVLIVDLMTRRRWAAVVAGLAFAVGHTIWTFAVMSEVLGWAAAFLSAECLCAWAWASPAGASRRQARWLLLLLFLNGVALSNHLMAAISLAVFGVWILAEVIRRRAPWWVLPAGAGLWLVGGTLYWIVVGLEYVRTASLAETLVSATVGGFGHAAVNVSDLPALVEKSFLYVGLNYPTPLVFAALVGLVTLWRRKGGFPRVLVVLALICFLWVARYDVPDQYSFFVPFYVAASVLIGVGVAAMRGRWGRWVAPVAVALALLPVAVYAVLPQAAERAEFVFFKRELPYRDPYTYFLQPWKRGDDGARRFATEVLDALPADAILLPDTTPAPPLKCLHDIEGRRPDVLIVDPYDVRFDDSLREYWPARPEDGSPPPPPEAFARGRRIFIVSDVKGYKPLWVDAHGVVEPFGLIFEVKPRTPGEGS